MSSAPRSAVMARVATNTLNQRVVPIIFLPGIMGSRLILDNKQEWDPDSDGNMLGWVACGFNRMRKLIHTNIGGKPQTKSDAYSEPECKRGWAGISNRFYGGLLRNMSIIDTAKLPVYGIGYDWRQEIGDCAAKAYEKLQAHRKDAGLEESDKVIIVTHSMGGLVTREMLRKFPDLHDKVLGIIHITQPVHGGAVLYRRFFTGVVAKFFGDVPDLDGLGKEAWGFARILGTEPRKFAFVVSGLKGAIQLLPTNYYRLDGNKPWLTYSESPGGAQQEWGGDVFDLYADAASPPGVVSHSKYAKGDDEIVKNDLLERVKLAKAFHAEIKNNQFNKHKNTYTIYGTLMRTDVAVGFFKLVETPPDKRNPGLVPDQRMEGDATVPLNSGIGLPLKISEKVLSPDAIPAALKEGYRQFRIDGVEHAAACNHANVIPIVRKLIDWILEGGTSTPDEPPPAPPETPPSSPQPQTGRRRRATRPMNEKAVDAANRALYAAHPELNGRTLSPTNDADAAYRTEWMDAYVAAGGEIEFY